MIAVEAVLIIIGLFFILGSFMVSDKLSDKDVDQISKLSEKELKMIVDKHLKRADAQVEDALDEKIEELMEVSKRSMEKSSNEKIMAINEYSDTVLESMNKTHNEIMFLYSMLNDKHSELTTLANQLQDFSKQMKETENMALKKLADAADELEQKMQSSELAEEPHVLSAAVSRENHEEGLSGDADGELEQNHNEDILMLHKAGKSDVVIAKELGLGLGEVKLVIGLYKEEEQSEI